MLHQDPPSSHLGLTAEIVAAYVSRNSVPAADLPALLTSVHGALVRVAGGLTAEPVPVPEPLKPAVPVRKSIQDDFIICLENGRPFKSLKRHLFSAYGLTPEEYRAKWGLPKDYPMVAPAYANARAMLARQIGLGRRSSDARLVASLPKPSLDVQAKRVPERAEVTIEQPRPGRRRAKTANDI